MNQELMNWLMAYRFKDEYASEQDWQNDFKKFCAAFKSKGNEILARK